MNENKAALGYQSFEEIRSNQIFYIDKTDFIKQWWEFADKVTLITRPRRFGKTLNMSMVECFFSNKYAGRSELFEGLSIWRNKTFTERQGTFPVIFLSFANIKAAKYSDMVYKISKVIADLYNSNDFLVDGDLLNDNEKEYYKSIKPGIGEEVVTDSIHSMANFMKRYFGKDVIILLDEYDTPMHEAWLSGYWNKAVRFFGNLFHATFKTNPFLERGLITGVTRIAKESIFTGLNNIEVVAATSDKYADCFGFTQQEVFSALDSAGLGGEAQEVQKWYDGFTFGTHKDIYNPWSIVSFINKKGVYEAYWINTSENGLVNSLIQEGSASVKSKMEGLLAGVPLCTAMDERIVFDQLDDDEQAIWSLLLATGYLKIESIIHSEEEALYTLMLTNLEVKIMFRKMIKNWFKGTSRVYYNEFINALLSDNVRKMNTFMNKVALNTFSSFDSGSKPSSQAEPERFYHGFVLGMVVDLSDKYTVLSNRESGYGRYDVMIKPHDKAEKAFIFEFKVIDPDEDEDVLEDTLANAHTQIENRQYEMELIDEGFSPGQIRKYGFAFKGKECLIG